MDSEEHTSADTASDAPTGGPGETLRAAREAQRLGLAQIAAQTRIPLRHLEAIEADDFESLPSRAYAIGFTRTYAKALGLDDVAVVDAVRSELADGAMRRTVPSPGMEPGDPARLPSRGLAWAAAGAVAVLVVGIFAFANTYFGAGTEPGSLLAPEPAERAAAPATPAAAAAAAAAPLPSGPVVLTALEDGIWLRLYEEGGERLTERTLKLGESVEVPLAARDPRINTGRPDALSVTIGGQQVAKLAEQPQTISGVAVSAAALAARGAATPAAAETGPATAVGAASAPRPARRRLSAPAPAGGGAAGSAGEAPAAASAPAPASEPASAGEAPPTASR
jgi:cytoskeletal protein RodZ